MKAIFETALVDGAPVLPPFESDDGYQLYFHDADGVLHGGYSMVGEPDGWKVRVQVDSDSGTIYKMKADSTYVWVSDIQEENI